MATPQGENYQADGASQAGDGAVGEVSKIGFEGSVDGGFITCTAIIFVRKKFLDEGCVIKRCDLLPASDPGSNDDC